MSLILSSLAAIAAQHGHVVDEHAARARPFPPLTAVRSIDGSGNHPLEAARGAALTPIVRVTSAAYADGVGAPAGARRASARIISNELCAAPASIPNARGVSDLFWQWGQFLDHDLTETPVDATGESLPIQVPAGDPYFDPYATGAATIPFTRSYVERVDGRREQLNAITAWIDGSQIYGSDGARARALRTLDGTGMLRSSAGDLLPFNTEGFANAPSSALASYFLAGDVRANEQVGLTALHTLFLREHNYWARRIAAEDAEWRDRAGLGGRGHGGRAHGGGRELSSADLMAQRHPALTDDDLYELARAIVSAELQVITYREWLPLLLGPGALAPESVYRPELDASISNEFATAAFRIGHSMLSSSLLRLDARGAVIPEGNLSLADAFFSPQEVQLTGIDPVLRGLASQRAQELDVYIIDDVRNFLFGAPGAGGLDLPALNIQRGRDHGLPSLAQARRDLGLPAPLTFAEVSSDPLVVDRLARSARSPEELDLWVGGLAEDHVEGALVGETFHALLVRQFTALRDGDRLWYTRQLPQRLVELVEGECLARVIRRNTGIGAELRERPFLSQ
ncbi:MAG: peroxidase family protein [Planctomycetota bacterium]